MQLSVNGIDTFVATGGRPFDPSLPAVVMLHGAGFDHSTWALHSRWFAHHGYTVLAPDLPGHGRSSGQPLPTIADMADWTAALLDAAGAPKAKLVGHSMGSLIALETSARHPDKVSGLSLIGTAATMTVGPDLLKAAEANDPDAFDMVSIWGLGFKAELGGSLAPGLWMHQGAQRVLQQTRPGVLFNDLNACNSYQNALAAAAQVKVPATFILGERDMMTPAKAGKTLAAATPNARTVVLPGAGHMMMAEAPDELLAALRPWRMISDSTNCAVLLATAKQMPCAPLMIAVLMPITSARDDTSGPPELPGLSAASVWITSSMVRPLTERIERPSADTTPAVTVDSKPRGLPIATTNWPRRRLLNCRARHSANRARRRRAAAPDRCRDRRRARARR